MQLGVIGLGTMGANLARNAARNGAEVFVYNRTAERAQEFMSAYGSEGKFTAASSYEELVHSFSGMKILLLMVKAGEAVDAVIADLLPLLSSGDILIDGGNSHFSDTERREKALQEKGIHFVGMGVSGGEEGALHGPSMMPGGSAASYAMLEPLFINMAADDGNGGACVAHIGNGGAGHFVKMVHNGIEYGIMQLIAEAYDMLKHVGGKSNEEIAAIFSQWSASATLQSFLMEITAKIFEKKDGDEYLVDLILDAAGQKGTGKWTTQTALDIGVAIPTSNAAVDARIISGSSLLREERITAWKNARAEHMTEAGFADALASALELSSLCAYQQGLDMIAAACEEYGWKIDVQEVARIWKGGCIIRSVLLEHFVAKKSTFAEAYTGEKILAWRRVVCDGVRAALPLHAFSASLAYYDAFTRERLPQSLIQAQRDYFGAHTFQRIDKKGVFHEHWGE